MIRVKCSLITVMATLLISVSVTQAITLQEVQRRGELLCGVSTGIPGFSNPDENGTWAGFDVDLCRAVAAATLGDASKIKVIPLAAKERLTAVQSGEVDLLSSNATWTLTRDTALGLHFAGINYYDGQGFMTLKNLGVKSALDLNGLTICIQSGTTTALNLADYFKENNMEYRAITFDTSDQTVRAFKAGRCDVLTSDQSQLYALRIKLENPENAEVLPEVISKEPLGPVVRQGDDAWFNIVRWTLFAMINAEENGVATANVDEMKKSTNPKVLRLLGIEGVKGKGLGLNDDWAYQVIKQVGNYGEVFERNVGRESPLKIDRGLNALWNKGGIIYAPPFR
ncbi:MAG: amino acid ABC transporter substrate-binding protein [Desulforhopalus sp.]